MEMKQLLKSFTHAKDGFLNTFREEQNFRIHLLAMFLAISGAFIFQVSLVEWFAIGGCITLVLSLELVNTAIENLSNAFTREKNESIGKAKDASAAACLIAAFFSFIVGIFIFTPRLITLAINF